MKVLLLLGAFLGAFVALDPLLTTFLLRDLPSLRSLPYALSLAVALTAATAFIGQRFLTRVSATVILDSWRYFPLLFLLAYQFTGVEVGVLDPTDVVLVVFILLLLAGLFIRPDQRFMSTPFNMLHLVIIICATISLVALFKPTGYLRCLKPFILFFLLVNCLSRDNLIPTFVRWLIVLAMLTAAFGIFQEITWLSSGTLLSLVPEWQLQMMMETVAGVPVFRIPAMMTGYRPCALFLGAALILSLSALLWRREAVLLRPRWLIMGLFLIVPALVLTLAKDILIGVLAAIALLLIMYRPKRFVPLAMITGLTGVLALLAAIAFVPGNIDTAMNLTRTIPQAEIERIRLDRDSIEGFVHGPYFWTGRGVFSGARYTAHTRRWPAHNAFILAAAELGIVGVTMLVLVYGLAFARAVALNVYVTSGPYLPIVRALPAIMVVITTGAQFEANYLEMFIWTMFATIEATWIVVQRQSAAVSRPVPAHASG